MDEALTFTRPLLPLTAARAAWYPPGHANRNQPIGTSAIILHETFSLFPQAYPEFVHLRKAERNYSKCDLMKIHSLVFPGFVFQGSLQFDYLECDSCQSGSNW